MGLYRLSDPEPPNGESTRPAARPDALILDFMEVRRQALLQELRFIEAELVTAGRITRLTVAPGRQR